ncbi:MAG: P-II family nitrogen regulator [Bacteroidales bacterium]|nr:P-II family nitrogen regulator [Bacteroidales bacterium]
MSENQFELILCIVNAGYSQNVMDAARQAGARGGTILRGRGSANPEAEEFFNITIQPDKEVVLILVSASIKDDVLKAVYKNSGLSTEGQGIAFSLPVERTTLTLRKDSDS